MGRAASADPKRLYGVFPPAIKAADTGAFGPCSRPEDPTRHGLCEDKAQALCEAHSQA